MYKGFSLPSSSDPENVAVPKRVLKWLLVNCENVFCSRRFFTYMNPNAAHKALHTNNTASNDGNVKYEAIRCCA